jgi:hypothetical protein
LADAWNIQDDRPAARALIFVGPFQRSRVLPEIALVALSLDVADIVGAAVIDG